MGKLLLVLLFFLTINMAAATEISFFEEFPNPQSFKLINQIDFPTKIYLASPSLSEFSKFEKKVNNSKVELVYWPVLKKEEGYWISPWADTKALERIFKEIEERKPKRHLSVMLDLEFPLNRELFFSEEFHTNKERIVGFMKENETHNLTLITVEKAWFSDQALDKMGLAFETQKHAHQRIKMFYTSFLRNKMPSFFVELIFKSVIKEASATKESLGIGLIAPGIHGTEPVYSPKILERELELITKSKVQEAVIFRLGGLNEEYLEVIKKFIKR